MRGVPTITQKLPPPLHIKKVTTLKMSDPLGFHTEISAPSQGQILFLLILTFPRSVEMDEMVVRRDPTTTHLNLVDIIIKRLHQRLLNLLP